MQVLIDIRKELRKRKLFDLADRIRDELAAKGIKLEDTADGAKWKRT
jgi:cysteinyl-tRNA synthetase